MQRIHTTVVAVVGPAAGSLEHIGGAANVRIAHLAAAEPQLERAVSAWEQARRTAAPYFLHDADPLAAVADAWIRRFDGQGPFGELDLAVAETLARWRGRSLELPDYYVLVDAEAWPATRRHWFLGVLAPAAPARVLMALATTGVVETLSHLPPGPWWPDLDRLLDGVESRVPDQTGRLEPGGREGGQGTLVASDPSVTSPMPGRGAWISNPD